MLGQLEMPTIGIGAGVGTDAQIFQVPAPGVMALLGVAGLVGARKRR